MFQRKLVKATHFSKFVCFCDNSLLLVQCILMDLLTNCGDHGINPAQKGALKYPRQHPLNAKA